MVSGIDASIRLMSAKLALKAIQEQQSAAESASTSKSPSLINSLEADSSSSSSTNSTLNKLLATYIYDDKSASGAEEPEISTDITTSDFMTGLKAQLKTMSEDAASSRQGKAMLQALEAGTLKVFDPVEGTAIKAWDASAKAEADTKTKPGTEIDAVGWSDFLKQHVKRDEGAPYAKDKNGSYVDAISGESAYFGTVGSKYYYFTWSQPEATKAATVTG